MSMMLFTAFDRLSTILGTGLLYAEGQTVALSLAYLMYVTLEIGFFRQHHFFEIHPGCVCHTNSFLFSVYVPEASS